MIGYICSAITDFVVTFASDADIVNLHNWSRGSFSGMTWENVAVMAGVTFVSAAAVFLLSKPIGAYQMGETYAKSMGVNVAHLRFFMVILSSILSGCVAAFAGPVSFVGIAVPHLIRWLFADTRPLVLIPGCFLGGFGYSQRNVADDVYDGVFSKLLITDGDKTVYDGRLPEVEKLADALNDKWNAVVNWFIKNL